MFLRDWYARYGFEVLRAVRYVAEDDEHLYCDITFMSRPPATAGAC